jgi:hypothetical protein
MEQPYIWYATFAIILIIGCLAFLLKPVKKKLPYEYRIIFTDLLEVARVAVTGTEQEKSALDVRDAVVKIAEANNLLSVPIVKFKSMIESLHDRIAAIEDLRGIRPKDLVVMEEEFKLIKKELEELQMIPEMRTHGLIFEGVIIRLEQSVTEKINAERPAFLRKIMD